MGHGESWFCSSLLDGHFGGVTPGSSTIISSSGSDSNNEDEDNSEDEDNDNDNDDENNYDDWHAELADLKVNMLEIL